MTYRDREREVDDYPGRMVRHIREVLADVEAGSLPVADAARRLDGIATAMDGSIPSHLRQAARTLANDLELIAYGGAADSLLTAARRFETLVASRDIR